MTLEELRKEWEEGLTVICKITTESCVRVVLKHEEEDSYRIHRYFGLNLLSGWAVSVDDTDLYADMVLRELDDNA